MPKYKMKARVITELEYIADSEVYGTDDPDEMARIDRNNFEDEPFLAEEDPASKTEVTVTVLEEVVEINETTSNEDED